MSAKSKSIALFRKLHRTRLVVFKGDASALAQTREKVKEEFRKNKHITDPEKLKELWKFGEEVDLLLRKTVIQCEYDEEKQRYRATVRDEVFCPENNEKNQ
uniref:Complex III assembly factor LYRM7 n=1 Tax=Mesocestoides corti TaxID=53468 RepID=A0A5K3EK56_MESCO